MCRNTILETGSGRHTKSHCIYDNIDLHNCLNNINTENLRIRHIATKFFRKDKDLTPWEPRYRSRMPATVIYQNKFGHHYVYPTMCKFQYMAGYAGFNKHVFSLYVLSVSLVSNNDLFIDSIVQNGRPWKVSIISEALQLTKNNTRVSRYGRNFICEQDSKTVINLDRYQSQ